MLKLLAPWNVARELIRGRGPAGALALHDPTDSKVRGGAREGSRLSQRSLSEFSTLYMCPPEKAPRATPTAGSKLDRVLFLVTLALLAATRPPLFAARPRGGGARDDDGGGVARAVPAHAWAYALVHALVPPCSGSFMSFGRFSATAVFPLFWAFDRDPAADGGARSRGVARTVALALALGGAAAVQAWLAWRFLQLEWAA